jgi:hypothetical protein
LSCKERNSSMLAFSMGSKGKREGVLIKKSPSCFFWV